MSLLLKGQGQPVRTLIAMIHYRNVILAVVLLTGNVWADPSSEMVGLWWLSHGDGAPLQMRVYVDGTAWSDYPANNPGRWRMEGDRLICVWADDWKEVLLPAPQGWNKLGYKPGTSLESAPSNRSRAVRATSQPNGWFGWDVAP